MRIGGQPFDLDLLSKCFSCDLAEAPLEKCAGVDARRGVPLDVDEVAAALVVRSAPEVVEADVVERGCGSEAGDVPAVLGADLVGLDHHRQGVPANDRTNPVLDARLSGHLRFHRLGDGVHVGRRGLVGQVCARTPHRVDEAFDEVPHAFDAVAVED